MKKYYMSKFNELYYCDEENKYILFNSNICNWMSFDEIGKQIYITLENNDDIKSSCNILMKEYNAEHNEIYSDVLEFYIKLKTNRFLYEKENVENVDTEVAQEYIDKYPYNVMMVSVTSACNLDCVYCYNKEIRCNSLKCELSCEETKIESMLKQFKQDGGIGVLFTGGEPLLYKKLPQLCSCAQKVGLKTKIITNATRLHCTPNLEDILMYVDDITLSLDSFDQKELRELWNVTDVNLDDLEKGLKRLNKYSREKKKMNVIISPIVSKVNQNSLAQVIKKVRELLRDCVLKIEPTKYMQIGKKCDDFLSISEEEYISTYISACTKNGMEGEKIYLSALTHNGKYYPYPIKNKFLCKPSFFIKEDGDVFPCQNLLDNKYFLGNVNKNSYKEINDNFISIMEKESLIKYSECRDCSFKYICPYKGGICRPKEEDCKKRLLKVMCASIK